MPNGRRKRIAAIPIHSTPTVDVWSLSDYQFMADTTMTIPPVIPIHPLSPISTVGTNTATTATTHSESPNTPQDHEPSPLHISSHHDLAPIQQASQPLTIPLPPLNSPFSPPQLTTTATATATIAAAATATYPAPFSFTSEADAAIIAAVGSPSIFTVGSVTTLRPPVPWPAEIKDLKTPINEEWPATPASEEDMLLFHMDEWRL